MHNYTPDSPIIIYGSLYHQEDNISSPQGGEIDQTKKIMTGNLDTPSKIILLSSSSDDIDQIYKIEGLNESRIKEYELVALSGTNPVVSSRTYSRVYSIKKYSGSPLVGSVTISAGSSIFGIMTPVKGSIPETTTLLNFLTNAVGRATVDTAFYEKFFIRNNSGQKITKLTIREYQSDYKERVLFAADPVFDGNSSSRNRLTKPGDLIPGDFLTDSDIIITDFPADSSIGIWVRLVIPAGEGAILNEWKTMLIADNYVTILTLLHPEAKHGGLPSAITERNNNIIGGGHNPLNYVELYGSKLIEKSYYEPDPKTFRGEYYYNTRYNKLFKKVLSSPYPIWKVMY